MTLSGGIFYPCVLYLQLVDFFQILFFSNSSTGLFTREGNRNKSTRFTCVKKFVRLCVSLLYTENCLFYAEKFYDQNFAQTNKNTLGVQNFFTLGVNKP